MSEQGEHLRAVSNIFGPPHRIRGCFLDMPAASEEDWAAIARRMARVSPGAGRVPGLPDRGRQRGMFAGPRVVLRLRRAARAVGGRLRRPRLVRRLRRASGRSGCAAVTSSTRRQPRRTRRPLRSRAGSAPSTCRRPSGTPDGVGADRYRVCARRWTGADLDPEEAYDWGWSQFFELQEQMRTEAEQVLPGAIGPAGDAAPGGKRRGHRRRRGDQDLAASDDGPGDHRSRRHPLSTSPTRSRPSRPGSLRRAAPPLRTTRARRRTSPGQGGPGCRRWAGPGSRCGG